ncbi:MAG: YbaN family protein [Candidatus Thermoplasmatota archaeon]|nr:YbaN family protein [Candidatus Thermoplasmatota archaeon]
MAKDQIDCKENILKRCVNCLFIISGTVSLAIGIIGIVLPVLPTTPFLLLAAACYAKGSKRFYDWLLGNKWFGNYIKNYYEGRGVPLKVKLYTVSLLWITILASAFLIIDAWWVRIILIVIAIGVTIHLYTIKTYNKEKE